LRAFRLVLAGVALIAVAQAQPTQVPSGTAPPGTRSISEALRKARQACVDAATAQGLQGYDLDRSVRTCLAKDLVTYERECQRQANERGLVGTEIRSFIRRCMTD
jgi:hypothetical protein